VRRLAEGLCLRLMPQTPVLRRRFVALVSRWRVRSSASADLAASAHTRADVMTLL
jgi:hypothetical protein